MAKDVVQKASVVDMPVTNGKPNEYHHLLNSRMLEWIAQAEKRNVRITSALLQERARTIAESIGYVSFGASSGWVVKFLRKHNIKLRALKKSAHLKANCQEGTNWEKRILQPRGDDPTADSDQEETYFEEGAAGSWKEPKELTLEGARAAWNHLQEWFILNPPQNDRVMSAIFIINKEITNPTSASRSSTSTIAHVLADGSTPSGGSGGGGSSAPAGGASSYSNKKARNSAQVAAAAAAAASSTASSTGTSSNGNSSSSFYAAIPAALQHR
eukprot:CAMPEP_0174963146 /NCGR_PEP_ID=MMETSP0004_2-20121128/5159_1 /TAXON_ID=420556 /ORGANISM="Ochromonas sp., Strain CCMP1393" /LENGTH=270 /DNA_ID=CAMNT_0016211721 /DNA_START=224 /DNA_END=1036 /DNA_ORIENTATION=-